MKKTKFIGLSLLVIFITISFLQLPAEASSLKRRPRYRVLHSPPHQFGFRTAYNNDTENWAAGAQYRIPIDKRGFLEIIPNGDIYFGEGVSDWQLNMDFAFRLLPRGGLYAGAGLAIADYEFIKHRHIHSDTEFGGSFFIGINPMFKRSAIYPYVEARFTSLDKRDYFQLAFGLNFAIIR